MADIEEGTTTALEAGFIPDVDEATGKWLDEIADDIQSRRSEYARSRDYYEGRHRVKLTARAKKYLQASGYPYAHNFCERVVDSLADRLEIAGVSVEVTFPKPTIPDEPAPDAEKPEPVTPPVAGAPVVPGDEEPAEEVDPLEEHEKRERAASDALTEWLNQRLEDIGFDELANIVHHEAVTSGDAYPFVYVDGEGKPTLTYALPDNCLPKYCDGNPLELEWVAKGWDDVIASEPVLRINVHYPDRVEKYAKTTSWGRWVDEDDENAWPLPWKDSSGKPRGLPFGHLRNKNRGRRYGTSELRTAIPQQDAINKRMVDLDLVSDNQGYQQRWATGIEGTSTLRNYPGSVWRTASATAKFGYFPAGDLSGVLGAIEAGVQHLAATTATPLHELMTSGTPPSGESKKTADSPLVKKVGDRTLTFGRQWQGKLTQLLTIGLDKGLVVVEGRDEARITVHIAWKDAEPRNEKEHWEVQLLKQSAGVSKHTTLQEDGYDSDREADLRKDETASTGMAFGSALLAGGEFGDAPA